MWQLNSAANQIDLPDPGEQIAQLRPYFPPHMLRTGVPNGPQFLKGSVLVADLTGFSARAALLFEANGQDDQTLQALVNRFFEIVLAESERFGGSSFTFDGDAISILFTGSRHPDVAIVAAQAIQKALAETVIELPTGSTSLRTNIGLASGPVLSGSFGSPDAPVYAVLGQTVTRAVQAQKLAGDGQIIVAESTLSGLSINLDLQPVKLGYYVVAGGEAELEGIPPVSRPAEAQSSDIAEFMAAHLPAPVTRQILTGEMSIDRRHIAALFVNVDGLGKLISSRGTDSVVDLNKFFGGLQVIFGRRGGFLNKVNAYAVGDKYLVLFGLSMLPCADPEMAALETAFELQDWVNELDFPLRQRVGLGVGQASECLVGSHLRREFTVIGRPVIEAVHLMARAGWGQILAVGDFCQNVQTQRWSNTPIQMLLKGYNRSITAYRFLPGGGQGYGEQ